MLIKPMVSEKSLKEAAGGKFTFAVDRLARKTDIKSRVEKMFGVKVKKVQTAKMVGKKYRAGKRWRYKTRPSGKKVVVTLAKGQKIDLFEAPKEGE